jgi:hypothetical protein
MQAMSSASHLSPTTSSRLCLILSLVLSLDRASRLCDQRSGHDYIIIKKTEQADMLPYPLSFTEPCESSRCRHLIHYH